MAQLPLVLVYPWPRIQIATELGSGDAPSTFTSRCITHNTSSFGILGRSKYKASKDMGLWLDLPIVYNLCPLTPTTTMPSCHCSKQRQSCRGQYLSRARRRFSAGFLQEWSSAMSDVPTVVRLGEKCLDRINGWVHLLINGNCIRVQPICILTFY